MPLALYVGAAAAALVLAIQVGFRLLRQRLEAQRQQGPN
jgi:hypothetical protein